MQELKQKLISIVLTRLDKEIIPSKRTLEIIDKIIQLNSLNQMKN
mgnify:CR=1 FL=1